MIPSVPLRTEGTVFMTPSLPFRTELKEPFS